MSKNLPNMITASRLVLATVLFVLLGSLEAGRADPEVGGWLGLVRDYEPAVLHTCLAIFVAAAISDILDGHLARRWGMQTDFGRIVDPFADKVTVCGTFVMLVPLEGSQVATWMVVLILARELLVDGLRGFAEARGVAFPAMASGKAKMVLQSMCLMWLLLGMASFKDSSWFAPVSFWFLVLVIAVTLLSGAQYVQHARRVLGADELASHRQETGEPAQQTAG